MKILTGLQVFPVGRAATDSARMEGERFVAVNVGNRRILRGGYRHARDVNVTPERAYAAAHGAVAFCKPLRRLAGCEMDRAAMTGAFDQLIDHERLLL